MANLALIPARGGSKRIPGKNKREFMGKPILLYAVQAAIDSGVFDKIMVSTDDPETASIATMAGAGIHQRSGMNSGDHATLSDVLSEVLNDDANRQFDYICMILPTAVLVTAESLNTALSVIKKNDFSSLVPVVRFPHPVQRALQIDGDQLLSFMDPQHKNTRSQDLDPAFHDAGQFYWVKTDQFLAERSIFMKRTGAIELPEHEVQDIDNETDWQLAELKFRLRNSNRP